MKLPSNQTATSLIESLIIILLIAGLLICINTTYTTYINLILTAKRNLKLAEQLEELAADVRASINQ